MNKYQEALDFLFDEAAQSYKIDEDDNELICTDETNSDEYLIPSNTLQELVDRATPTFVICNEWRGTRLTRYTCPYCKKQVRNDEEYCHKCGQHIKFPKIKVADNKAYLDWET